MVLFFFVVAAAFLMFLFAAVRCFSVAMEPHLHSPGNRCLESCEGKPQIRCENCPTAGSRYYLDRQRCELTRLADPTIQFQFLIE